MITQDRLWKGIIEDLFADFLHYFRPNLAQNEVDFSKGFEFMDKDLDILQPESERGLRHADKLVKFYTKTGGYKFVLLHIEVQGYKDPHFAERMFEYHYRIRDKWKVPVCAFVLYTNQETDFQPLAYTESFDETEILYRFPVFKLIKKQAQDLEVKGNPFSIVMKVAHKALQKQLLSDDKQLVWKKKLVKELSAAGFSVDKVRNILDFIRLYVSFAVPTNAQNLDQEIDQIIKPLKNMGLQEIIKEAYIEEGVSQGELKGKKEAVFGMLAEGLSVDAVVRIIKLPLDTITEWKKEWEKTR
jgi:hypothetical protein